MISIIIPAFNHEKKIQRTIESVLSQTFKKFELLISDDSSQDNTYKIAKSYEAKDARIKVFKQYKNLGPSENTNFLTLKAKYDYLCACSSDDFFEKDKIENQFKFLNEENLDFTFTHVNVVNENVKEIDQTNCEEFENLFNQKIKKNKQNINDQIIKSLFFNGNFICGTTLLCKTNIAKDNLWDKKYLQLQDYAQWIKWISKGFKIGILEKKLHNYVLHKNLSLNLSKGTTNLSSVERIKILENFLFFPYSSKLLLFDKNDNFFEKINEKNINFYICKKAILNENLDLKMFGCINILNYLDTENQKEIFQLVKENFFLEKFLFIKEKYSVIATRDNFDPKKYAEFNEDIKKAFKDDYDKIHDHFLKFGISEKRRQFK